MPTTSIETPPVLDLARLLAPVPGAAAAGRDLRADDGGRAILGAVRASHTTATNREFSRRRDGDDYRGESPAWQSVVDEAERILANETKDTQVAMFLAVAATRLKGVAGLRDGIRLMTGLVERFGAELAPRGDAGAFERIEEAFGGSSPQLLRPFEEAPLFSARQGDRDLIVTLAEWRGASDVRYVAGRQAAKLPVVTRDWLMEQVKSLNPDMIRSLVADLAACRSGLAALVAACAAAGWSQTLSIEALDKALDQTIQLIGTLGIDLGQSASPGAAAPAGVQAVAQPGAAPASAALVPDTFTGREQALEAILRVAAYFERIEPQGTVALDLKKAVRRGRMHMADVLADLVGSDEGVLTAAYRDLGIERKDKDKSS